MAWSEYHVQQVLTGNHVPPTEDKATVRTIPKCTCTMLTGANKYPSAQAPIHTRRPQHLHSTCTALR